MKHSIVIEGPLYSWPTCDLIGCCECGACWPVGVDKDSATCPCCLKEADIKQ